MSQDKFDEMVKSFLKKKEKFIDSIKIDSKKLSLNDILNKIELESSYIDTIFKSFNYGDEIEINFFQHYFKVLVNYNCLKLYLDGIELNSFNEPTIKEFYEKQAKRILDLKEKYKKNLPF